MERGTPEQRVNRKRKNKTFKIVVLWMMILSAIWLPCGCIRKKPEITGEKSAAFQLMSEREIPEELKEWMERDYKVTGVQTCALPIWCGSRQVFWDRKKERKQRMS